MGNKIKAQVCTEANGEELYGYTQAIVYNEVKEGSKIGANKDVPLMGSLHSKEAMETAAKSLRDD